jgi:hypothetical protein
MEQNRAYLLTIETLAAKLDAAELENGTLRAKLERALAERDSAIGNARKVVPIRADAPAPAPVPVLAPAPAEYGVRLKKAGRDVHAGDTIEGVKIVSVQMVDGAFQITIDPGGVIGL